MSTPSEIMVNIAALMNDQDRAVYTDLVILPYFNMGLNELQEIFELNNIPVTNFTSATINCPSGTTVIGFDTTPGLPSDLIEIRQLWESFEDQNQWTPMQRMEFLPHYLENGVELTQFLIWAYWNQQVHVIPANTDLDIKIDYVKDLFATLTEADLNTDLAIKNINSYMHYKVAALCSFFIGENETRAEVLQGQADNAMSRSLGISIKGSQSIATRRRPYLAAYKMRGSSFR